MREAPTSPVPSFRRPMRPAPARLGLAMLALALPLTSPAVAAADPTSAPQADRMVDTLPVSAATAFGAAGADDVLVVEGDILTSASGGSMGGFRGVGPGGAGRLWPNGEVPYRLDPTLAPGSVSAIEAAVAMWNAIGGITLVEIGSEAATRDGVTDDADHLLFQVGPGCASWVGRQGGAQAVWIGPSCTAGSAMHEIGHALGLEHEHTRPDRDGHIRVLWDNVAPEKRHNFEPAPRGSLLLGDYDIASIMHYGPNNFSVDGRRTLEPLDPASAGRMGQRDRPSAGDVAAVARLYASDLSLEISAGEETTLFVTNQHAQGAHDVSVAIETEGASGSVSIGRESAGDWRCSADGVVPAEAASSESLRTTGAIACRLPRLAGGASSRLVLTMDPATLDTGLVASVGSKTPDLDPTNNAGRTNGRVAPPMARALAEPVVLADVSFAADDGTGRGVQATSGGAAFGWLWVGALLAGWRRRRPLARG